MLRYTDRQTPLTKGGKTMDNKRSLIALLLVLSFGSLAWAEEEVQKEYYPNKQLKSEK